MRTTCYLANTAYNVVRTRFYFRVHEILCIVHEIISNAHEITNSAHEILCRRHGGVFSKRNFISGGGGGLF